MDFKNKDIRRSAPELFIFIKNYIIIRLKDFALRGIVYFCLSDFKSIKTKRSFVINKK